MTTYAHVTTKTAPLASDFAKDFVSRRFGPEAMELIYILLPKFSRGPRKGLVKGYVAWDKVERGGWVRENGYGHVETPGTKNVRIVSGNDPYARGFFERSHWASDTTPEQWLATVRRGINEIFQLEVA